MFLFTSMEKKLVRIRLIFMKFDKKATNLF